MTTGRLFGLSGKTAPITGGSRGLQTAEALGEAGVRLLIFSRRAAELEIALRHLEARGATVDGVAQKIRCEGNSLCY